MPEFLENYIISRMLQSFEPDNTFPCLVRGKYHCTVDLIYCFEFNQTSKLLARSSQDVFLLPLIPWIEQGGSILLVTLLYDLCDGLTIFKLNGMSEYRSPTLCLLMNQDCNTTWDNKLVTLNGIRGSSANHLQIIVILLQKQVSLSLILI